MYKILTNFQGSDFSGANLTGAVLLDVTLDEERFKGALCIGKAKLDGNQRSRTVMKRVE
ncbi:pentapeptide repeat-containing protein [Bifidobacterium aquikefiricola]|uniref:pentapeptide repeat-containing protein n=1 Tax=Bifidobacterium TaxID=1678 RepID=UPI0034E2135C